MSEDEDLDNWGRLSVGGRKEECGATRCVGRAKPGRRAGLRGRGEQAARAKRLSDGAGPRDWNGPWGAGGRPSWAKYREERNKILFYFLNEFPNKF